MKYILSIGTNIGNRMENIENCIDAINLTPYTDVLIRSGIYETEPVGYARQQNFYNCNVLVESELEPNEMLGMCLGIESGFGRIRAIKNGPRVLDIDLLMAEDFKTKTKNLTCPHPRMFERRFVLQPMLDIFENGIVFGVDIKPYLEKIEGQEVTKIEDKIDYHIM
ncbi:MAG: 2-amino-4-hydroxy-6-hydroxymethyldihydropteridine diphosphokinase [Eubacterium sp.]|nr:2-amino-4-hydroxy-6-hydroxymethyldihydropteridine diphosphokinase [Eubacterium sp.]